MGFEWAKGLKRRMNGRMEIDVAARVLARMRIGPKHILTAACNGPSATPSAACNGPSAIPCAACNGHSVLAQRIMRGK